MSEDSRSALAIRTLATVAALVHLPAGLVTGFLALLAVLYATSAPSPWPLLGIAVGLAVIAGIVVYGGVRGVLAFRRGAPTARWATWFVVPLVGPAVVLGLQVATS